MKKLDPNFITKFLFRGIPQNFGDCFKVILGFFFFCLAFRSYLGILMNKNYLWNFMINFEIISEIVSRFGIVFSGISGMDTRHSGDGYISYSSNFFPQVLGIVSKLFPEFLEVIGIGVHRGFFLRYIE